MSQRQFWIWRNEFYNNRIYRVRISRLKKMGPYRDVVKDNCEMENGEGYSEYLKIEREKKEALVDDVSTDQWAVTPAREVTTTELDEVVRALKVARDEYDLAKTISSEKNSVVDGLEGKLIELLTIANKNSYEVDGIARVTVVTKSQVTTPKSIEAKEAFFNWVESKLGREGLLAYQTINFATLNSLYNTEMKLALERGEDFNVPGIELPNIVRTLMVRAK